MGMKLKGSENKSAGYGSGVESGWDVKSGLGVSNGE